MSVEKGKIFGLIGPNGSGKTTVLEGIHLLTYGKSFKTHKQNQLIQQGKKTAIIKGVFLKNQREDVVAAQIEKTNRRKIKLNGKNILILKVTDSIKHGDRIDIATLINKALNN